MKTNEHLALSSREGAGEDAPLSRRRFLAATGLAAAVAGFESPTGAVLPTGAAAARHPEALTVQPEQAAAPASHITIDSIAQAEKVAALDFTPQEREMLLRGVQQAARSYTRRRETPLPNGLAPATTFDPRLPGIALSDAPSRFVRSQADPGPLPAADIDIAYAPVTSLSRWIERGELSSERLTRLYLERLDRIAPKLECIITITADLALEQAKRADAEIGAGRYRGPLHGIPYGAKDLFDTAGIRTSWGATPYKNRVPETDAAVVRKLNDAGAVLIAKTTLGALAYGDQWFGGRTNNPFNLEQGSSGSSAGSAAGVVAGLFAFALGTETLGSIVSPSMRCGATGLRPTFGRVPRTGAMALCWSLDKVGPLARTVEDCALVLDAIRGRDDGDPSSLDVSFTFDASAPLEAIRIGYDSAWFEGRGAVDLDRAALDAMKQTGAQLVPITLPEMNAARLRTILNVEAAAAFEELTLTNRDDELVWQAPQAWPNTFRETWFVPAIEFLQAQRIRRQVCETLARVFENVDCLIGPSFAANLLLITNNTGHPCVCLRTGFREGNRPHGITLWGRLFEEGTVCRAAMELEQRLGVWSVRPGIE